MDTLAAPVPQALLGVGFLYRGRSGGPDLHSSA